MKKRFSEEQIIGFLREAEAGLPVKELCRRHGFSEASYYLWRSKFPDGPHLRRLGRDQKPGLALAQFDALGRLWIRRAARRHGRRMVVYRRHDGRAGMTGAPKG